MSGQKVIVVARGGLTEETKTPQPWAELLCSRSAKGCGTVFWATKSSGEYTRSLDDGYGSDFLGWRTACPKCHKPVGGHDVKFIDIFEPPKDDMLGLKLA